MINLLYDGSFSGYLTAVYEGFYLRTNDLHLVNKKREEIPFFFTCKEVSTDEEKVEKVSSAILKKLGEHMYATVHSAWCSHLPEIDDAVFSFLKLAFARNQDLTENLQNPIVAKVVKAQQRADREAHLFLGITRFHKIRGFYLADIEPDCDILPLIAEHFIDRFSTSAFVIRDISNGQILIHRGEESRMMEMFDFIPMETLMTEDDCFERYFTAYYKAMAIRERLNRKCMMQHMPKKYWKHMTEKR